MRKLKRKYETPRRPWDKERIEKEKIILKNFGLKKKREVWKAEGLLRKYRRMARELAAKRDKETEKRLIEKLVKLGILKEGAVLDDVLGLSLDNILERRLQMVVMKAGFATTTKQARQFITHGHVLIGGKRVVYPSYMVSKNEEGKISVAVSAPRKKEVVNEAPKTE